MDSNGPRLSAALLETIALSDQPGSLEAAPANLRGLYQTFQFVLRLSPEVHRILADLPSGVVTSSEIGFRGAEAFSTLLHETIHWWQHIGSTYGLIFSLTYPAEAHGNYGHLKALSAIVGHKKSIRTLSLALGDEVAPWTASGLANIIVNNQFDFDAFRRLTFSPTSRQAVAELEQFESVGHAFRVTYGNTVSLLAAAADPHFEVMPNPATWHQSLVNLAANEEPGYFHGSDVALVPVGVRQIMEGQARFAQIQYLHFASGGHFGWDDFREIGMLNSGVYRDAFDFFLTLSELDWPDGVNHSTVAIFLLICDMAINPGAGFPFGVKYPSAFIDDVDPGMRFAFLAREARTQGPALADLVRNYSRSGYIAASEKLAEALMLDAPMAIAEEIASWPARCATVRGLMDEHATFEFKPVNQPVRVLLSHAISFAADKARRPEVFCWPGAWMAGERVSDEIAELFKKHGALFTDKADDDGVFPVPQEGRDEQVVHAAFERFYAANVTYDMTRQWVTEDGPFKYQYNWLVQRADHDAMKTFADDVFASVYGARPDDFELVDPVKS